MTGQRILLLGAGGHGKAIADLLLAGGAYDLVGFVDAAPKASQILGLPVLGDESQLAALAGQGVTLAHAAVGDNGQRLAAAGRLRAAGFALPSLIHPAALIGHGAMIADGAAILARADQGSCPNTHPTGQHGAGADMRGLGHQAIMFHNGAGIDQGERADLSL
ncbi:MAG: hypothetical protein ACKO9A_21625, partial [Alphaproteobacteria bacterium]